MRNVWEPASTAPKDGTTILAIYLYPVSGGTRDYGLIRWTDDWNKDGSGEWADQFCDHLWMEPTFWQPLPPAPDMTGRKPPTNPK